MPNGLENLRDENLAALALAPSLAHFEELVRRYHVPLRHFLARRFPSRQDADDILQDSFLKAWQALRQYNPDFPFRTWLYTIVYRTAISHGRRDRPAQSLSPALPADVPAPDARAAGQDQRHMIWRRAREILSDEQFTALWLHYVDDLPAQDVARVLQCSWVNVKTMMHRARKKLAPFLSDPGARTARAAEAPPGDAPPENKSAVLCLAKNR